MDGELMCVTVSSAVNNLVHYYCRKRMWRESISTLERSLRLSREDLPSCHPVITASQFSLILSVTCMFVKLSLCGSL